MATKRLSPDEPIYPPKKRALFEHKRQAELLKKGLETLNQNNDESKNEFLAMKMKLESSQSELVCMRPRSDSLQSMHSLMSNQSDLSNLTVSREPSPNIELHAYDNYDSRTPERNPVDSYKPEISKLLFPDLGAVNTESKDAGFLIQKPVEQFNTINQTMISRSRNEAIRDSDSSSPEMMREAVFDKDSNELHVPRNEAEDDSHVNEKVREIGNNPANQPQSSTLLHIDAFQQKSRNCSLKQAAVTSFSLKSDEMSKRTRLTENSMYVGPMVSLISRFDQEAMNSNLNKEANNMLPTPTDLNNSLKHSMNHQEENETPSNPLMSLSELNMFRCRICDKKFDLQDDLKTHMQDEHSGPLPYKCQHCPRAFSQYNNLQRHLRVHRAKIYKCNLCDREFNEEFYLKMHMGTHTGRRVYSCGVCSAPFSSNQELKLHVKTHSPSQLHTCDVCGKSFSKACVLRQHKKGHSGVRPHKCDKCPKTFIHRHHLTMHLKSHTDVKPYTCEVCHKEFYQSSHLYKHMKSCHEEGVNVTIPIENTVKEQDKTDDGTKSTNLHKNNINNVNNDFPTNNQKGKNDTEVSVLKAKQNNNNSLYKAANNNLPKKTKKAQTGVIRTQGQHSSTPQAQQLPSLSEAFLSKPYATNTLPYHSQYNHLGHQSSTYNHPTSMNAGAYSFPYHQQGMYQGYQHSNHYQAYYNHMYMMQYHEQLKNSQKEYTLRNVEQPNNQKQDRQSGQRDLVNYGSENDKENIMTDKQRKQGKGEADMNRSEAAAELIKMSERAAKKMETNKPVEHWRPIVEKNDSKDIHRDYQQPIASLPNDRNETSSKESEHKIIESRPLFSNHFDKTNYSSTYNVLSPLAPSYYSPNQLMNSHRSVLGSTSTYSFPGQNKSTENYIAAFQKKPRNCSLTQAAVTSFSLKSGNMHLQQLGTDNPSHTSQIQQPVLSSFYNMNMPYPYYNIGLSQHTASKYLSTPISQKRIDIQDGHNLPLNLSSPNSPKKWHYSEQDGYLIKRPKLNDKDGYIIKRPRLSDLGARHRHQSDNPRIISPVDPSIKSPADPRITSPTYPRIRSPVDARGSSSVDPGSISLADPSNRSPVDPRIISPANPRIVSPVDPRIISPANPRIVSPVDPRITSQVDPMGSSPVDPRIKSLTDLRNSSPTDNLSSVSSLKKDRDFTETETQEKDSQITDFDNETSISDHSTQQASNDEDSYNETENMDTNRSELVEESRLKNMTNVELSKNDFNEDQNISVDEQKAKEIDSFPSYPTDINNSYCENDFDCNENEDETTFCDDNNSETDNEPADSTVNKGEKANDNNVDSVHHKIDARKHNTSDKNENENDNVSIHKDNSLNEDNLEIHDTSGALDLSVKEHAVNTMTHNADRTKSDDEEIENIERTRDHGMEGRDLEANLNMTGDRTKGDNSDTGRSSKNSDIDLMATGSRTRTDVFNTCGICWKEFTTVSELHTHQIEHVQNLEIANKCQTCGKTFSNHFNLQCHLIKHREELSSKIADVNNGLQTVDGDKKQVKNLKNRQSPELFYELTSKMASINGLGTVDNDKKGKNLKNRQSPELFLDMDDLENKSKIGQTGYSDVNNVKSWIMSNVMKNYTVNQSKQTGYRYENTMLDSSKEFKENQSSNLQTGIRNGENSLSQLSNGSNNTEQEQIAAFHGKPRNCSLKQAAVTRFSMKNDNTPKEYKCNICLHVFAKKHNLARHMISHVRKSYKCGVCERTFKEKFYLQMHEKTHKNETMQDCEICGECVPRDEFLTHTNKHYGVIADNPTYKEIGYRVSELLKEKEKEKQNFHVVKPNNDNRIVLGERKENVANITKNTSSEQKSKTHCIRKLPGLHRIEENAENVPQLNVKNYLLERPMKQSYEAFKLKNYNIMGNC